MCSRRVTQHLRAGEPHGGIDDGSAAFGAFAWVGGIGPGQQANRLWHGEPPAGQREQQEDQIGGVKRVIDQPVALSGGNGGVPLAPSRRSFIS